MTTKEKTFSNSNKNHMCGAGHPCAANLFQESRQHGSELPESWIAEKPGHRSKDVEMNELNSDKREVLAMIESPWIRRQAFWRLNPDSAGAPIASLRISAESKLLEPWLCFWRVKETMRAAAGDEFRELLNLVRKSGLLVKQPAYYSRKMLLNLAMLAGAFLLIARFHNPWAELCEAAFLAFVFAQLGFIVHDAGHQEIFSGPAWNEATGLIHSNLLLGFSYSWWLNKHNLHHSSPNHVTVDPDVDIPLFAFTKEQAAEKHGLARLTVKYQHLCFFPLSLLEAFVLKYDSVQFLRRNRVAHPVIEVSALILHGCWFLGLLCLFLGWRNAILFFLAQQMFLGLYLTLIFAPNHQGMPLLQGTAAVNFLREQVLTSRNIKNHPGIDYCTGGLTCQIEHHLFPTMPANKLRKVQKIVKAYCASHGVAYHETSLFQSFREVYRDLRENSLIVSRGFEGNTVTNRQDI
jgi:fatty acid desaturase